MTANSISDETPIATKLSGFQQKGKSDCSEILMRLQNRLINFFRVTACYLTSPAALISLFFIHVILSQGTNQAETFF